jgi:hypothetical protein
MMTSKTTPAIIIHFLFAVRKPNDWGGEALAVSVGGRFCPAFETGNFSLSGTKTNGV